MFQFSSMICVCHQIVSILSKVFNDSGIGPIKCIFTPYSKRGATGKSTQTFWVPCMSRIHLWAKLAVLAKNVPSQILCLPFQPRRSSRCGSRWVGRQMRCLPKAAGDELVRVAVSDMPVSSSLCEGTGMDFTDLMASIPSKGGKYSGNWKKVQ